MIGENGLLKELTKAILERALHAELTDPLDSAKRARRATKRATRRDMPCLMRVLGVCLFPY
jgi:transposase-like protein